MIELHRTCWACPEQYDAKLAGKTVGYLRLRHGFFSVECPDVGGEIVYESHPAGDGIFETEEREFYLSQAKKAIEEWIAKRIE